MEPSNQEGRIRAMRTDEVEQQREAIGKLTPKKKIFFSAQ